MARRLIVDDLIADVRSQIDEANQESISDTADILPALNRAQDKGANILARHYEAPLLAHTRVTLVNGQQEYDIPEDAFEQRLERVEVEVQGTFYGLKRIDYRDLADYEVQTTSATPMYYCVIGTKYRLVPEPTAVYPLRIWYLRDPDVLVQSQGRISVVNSGSNYVILEEAGGDLTTEADSLDSYVNVVDGQSGIIKCTMQVQQINGNKITFKSTPARSTVLNRTVSGSLDSTVSADDLLCLVHGTCVPFIKKPLSNFLIQYAVAEMTRKLGGQADIEHNILKELEAQVEHSWVGREVSARVNRVNPQWTPRYRRYLINQ